MYADVWGWHSPSGEKRGVKNRSRIPEASFLVLHRGDGVFKQAHLLPLALQGDGVQVKPQDDAREPRAVSGEDRHPSAVLSEFIQLLFLQSQWLSPFSIFQLLLSPNRRGPKPYRSQFFGKMAPGCGCLFKMDLSLKYKQVLAN